MSNFSEKLQQLAHRNGLSQAKIAQMIGVNQKTISNWMSGLIIPKFPKVTRLAEIFGIQRELLLDDTRELPSLTFKEHNEILGEAADAARYTFPDDEKKGISIAEALIGAGYAMKAIPRLEDRLEKLETGMAETVKLIKGLRNNYEAENPKHNSLKTNDGKVATVAILKNETGINPLEKRLNRIESEIDRIRAALERLIGGAEAEKRPATLEEIAEARKMAERLLADITARKRKKKAE